MRKPSNVEAIRFHAFVFRHFGNGLSNSKGQTWYLYNDNHKKRYWEIWHEKGNDETKREKCLLITDIYKLFLKCEKKFGLYGVVDDDLIEEFLSEKVPIN